MRARFTGLGLAGRKIVAWIPKSFAAKATAAPWLPVLEAVTSWIGRRAVLRERA